MSPAKPEIHHWGGGFSEDKFGTNDNPRTRDSEYKEAVDKGLNPEEALLAKEEGEDDFDAGETPESWVTAKQDLYIGDIKARHEKEKIAGWSPIKGEAKGNILKESGLVEEGFKIQEGHDKGILAEVRDIKDKSRKLRTAKRRTDKHKIKGRESIRAA